MQKNDLWFDDNAIMLLSSKRTVKVTIPYEVTGNAI
jgi:hypothetical protein